MSPGAVGHRRSDRNDGSARVLLQFAPCSEGLYLFVGQCQVTRDQFSVEQDECPEENLIPSLPQLQGRVCLNCGRVWGHLRREERKKTYTKNQPRAVLSQFSLLETPSFPRVKFTCSFRSMFKCTTLWTCDLVTKSICVTEEVAQRLACARQRLWGWRAWISPRGAQGQAAGCQGREHSLSHICVLPGAWTFTSDIFSSWIWAAELLYDPGVPGGRGALAPCLGPLGASEDPEVSVCVNPASLGVPEHPFVGTGESWGRWSCQPPPCPLSFYPECAQSPLSAQFELNISGGSYWCFLLN